MSTPAKAVPWNPLLDSDLARTALASVGEIAADLKSHLEDWQHSSEQSPYLGEGAAGIAVFFTYLNAAGLSLDRNPALEYLNLSKNALTGQVMEPSLFAGFTGITWAAQHISGFFVSPDDPGEDIDLALETYLSRSPWKQDYDLINGLAGLGVYCLERSCSPPAARCLELIVKRLGELAQSSWEDLCWFTAASLLSPPQREMYPGGYYNLGLAHGVPGIMALLGRIHATGIARQEAGRLLEGAVHWLLRQQLPEDANSSFAAFLVPGGLPEDCRLAWCYGDAGIAAAILLAARYTGMKTWESAALKIARRAATRNPQSCGVMDACFCHGSSGLAHIFNRIHHATHDEVFAEAARFWVQRTLEFRTPGTGAAGYSILSPSETGKMEFQKKFGLIDGIAGIGLSLLAAISNVEPLWDRVFMVDIPPVVRP
ncbi:MAG TPA: lanthionine synthetase C family protein [Candidatus Angelobacter sp.]